MNNGIWNSEFAKHHQSSEKLAKWLSEYLPKEFHVIDFGCGTGYYMGYLEQNGFTTTGVDGYKPETPLCKDFIQHDLTKFIDLGLKGIVLCLETLEHIDKSYEDVAVNNLLMHCNSILIVSWASVGQPGIGHINCQNSDYVIELFSNHGFKLLSDETAKCRNNVDENCDWFKRNILIFERI